MLSVKLVVVGGESKNKEVNLRLPTIIGRGREGVSLTLPHPLVSRKHTEIFEHNGQLYVKDLGSLNGTFVNSQRISEKTLLKPNELLTLGNVTFRAMYDVETPEPVAVDSSPVESAGSAEASSVDVLNEEKAKSDGSDTDKSIVIADVEVASVEDKEETAEAFGVSEPAVAIAEGGVVFTPEQGDGESRKAPVSIRAIEGLPAGNQQKGVDFAVNLEGTAKPETVEEVSIDLDETIPAPVAGDSRLGSFLKKMPR